jgi:hypothetical protein
LATFSLAFGGLQGLVDAADPLLFEGHGVHRGDLHPGLREGKAGGGGGKGGREGEQVTAGADHGLLQVD